MNQPTPFALRNILQAGVLIVAAALAGCASTQMAQQPSSPEAAVQQRSDAFWQARMRDDAQAAYMYTSPSYRKIYDLEQFRADYAGKTLANNREVVSVTCNEAYTQCTVKQRLDAKLPMAGNTPISVYVDEQWLREDDQWWIFKK